MLLRPLLALALASASCMFMPGARAGGTEGVVKPEDIRVWLMRIHDAASQRNFQGTFVVSGSGAVSSSRIAHYTEGSHQYERIESLDGEARQMFRHDEMVHVLWPQARVAVLEQRDRINSFPALLQGGNDRIADFYKLTAQGSDRVAGHDANVLLLTPRDGNRFGYRLWAEKGTGLLLRSDVLGAHGEVLETAAFSDVAINVHAEPQTVLTPVRRLEGYHVLRRRLQQTRLDAEGWALRDEVPGFRQISCVKRSTEGEHAGAEIGASVDALQTVFSDGLTYVSVFIEPFDAGRHTRALMTSSGATQTWMRRRGDWWLTAVGDVPVTTLRTFANGFERQK